MLPVENQVQLITYPDSLGGGLSSLARLLETRFAGLFGGVHILPPYPSSGDRGFAPTTYFEIDPRFGDWEDLSGIARRHPVMLDLMVNHISRQSAVCQDFIQKGRRSPYADLFITLDKVWPGGSPPSSDVSQIFLRRPDHPFTDLAIAETGQTERVWATFGSREAPEQIDLDVNSPQTRQLFDEILGWMGARQVRFLRLDAVGYVIKKPGTSCFFVEPEIYAFLDWMRAAAGRVGIELIPEVHGDPTLQQRLADRGFQVYNFVLPFLTLHALLSGSGAELAAHLQSCPRRQITMLDCHDGIPVQPDISGLVDLTAARQTVQACLGRGANLSRILSTAHQAAPGFDAHQVNCTYYSALGADEEAYLAARAIQLFAPGVPQVYYVGLLAGVNDPQGVTRTGERRAINRHDYTQGEVEQALQKPVVQRLLRLIRFRNTHPAFMGEFQVIPTPESSGRIALAWENGDACCRLRVNLQAPSAKIEYTDRSGEMCWYTP